MDRREREALDRWLTTDPRDEDELTPEQQKQLEDNEAYYEAQIALQPDPCPECD